MLRRHARTGPDICWLRRLSFTDAGQGRWKPGSYGLDWIVPPLGIATIRGMYTKVSGGYGVDATQQ